MTQALQIYLAGRVAFDRVAGGWILLMTGHAGDRVVQDDDGRIALIIRNVDQSGHARVHKGAVADHTHGFALGLFAAGLVVAVQTRYGRAHAKRHIQRVQRRHRPERITADIAQYGELVLRQNIVHSAVGTAGAHHRGTHRYVGVKRQHGLVLDTKRLSDRFLAELT